MPRIRRRPQPCLICHDPTREQRPRCNHPCHASCVTAWRAIRTDLPASACPVCDLSTAGQNNVRDIRYCPGCGMGIQKNGGCNFMQCVICDHSFDWNTAPQTQPQRPIHSLHDIQQRKEAAIASNASRQRRQRTDAIMMAVVLVIMFAVLTYLIYQDKFTHEGQVACLERNIYKSMKEADYMQQNIAALLEKVRYYETKIAALRVVAPTPVQ